MASVARCTQQTAARRTATSNEPLEAIRHTLTRTHPQVTGHISHIYEVVNNIYNAIVRTARRQAASQFAATAARRQAAAQSDSKIRCFILAVLALVSAFV